MVNVLSKTILLLIKSYQYCISPLLGNRCRFFPSCSSYATDAIKIHGLRYGCYLTLKRLLRCHPWHLSYIDPIDPIPERKIKC